jgi:hypothetical protein
MKSRWLFWELLVLAVVLLILSYAFTVYAQETEPFEVIGVKIYETKTEKILDISVKNEKNDASFWINPVFGSYKMEVCKSGCVSIHPLKIEDDELWFNFQFKGAAWKKLQEILGQYKSIIVPCGMEEGCKVYVF